MESRRAIAQVADALAIRTGLDFAGSHQARMHAALEHELRDTSHRTSGEYVAHLGRNPHAYAQLIERLTVGETYFFRDPAQMALLRTIVASWTTRPRVRRVWSAGCATGEEPYTLAIVLDEAGLLDRTRVLGTDLSERSIERARHASYGKWSLRRTDQDLRDRYFTERQGRHVLASRFVDAVEYRVQSLLDGPPAAGAYDLVLCRNVLIYLHGDALQRAARSLRDSLSPQGQLIVGASDPALPIDGLELVRTDHGFLYRLDTARADVAPTPEPTQLAGAHRTCSEPVRRSAPRRRLRDARTAPGGESEPALTGSPQQPGSSLETIADAVASLTAAGRVDAAERFVASAVDDSPLDAEARLLAATLHLRAGRLAEAAAAAAAAVYLEPELVIAHLLLGRIEMQRDAPVPARRSLLTAVELLSEMPPDEEVPGSGGERAASVIDAVTELLHTSEQG